MHFVVILIEMLVCISNTLGYDRVDLHLKYCFLKSDNVSIFLKIYL